MFCNELITWCEAWSAEAWHSSNCLHACPIIFRPKLKQQLLREAMAKLIDKPPGRPVLRYFARGQHRPDPQQFGKWAKYGPECINCGCSFLYHSCVHFSSFPDADTFTFELLAPCVVSAHKNNNYYYHWQNQMNTFSGFHNE